MFMPPADDCIVMFCCNLFEARPNVRSSREKPLPQLSCNVYFPQPIRRLFDFMFIELANLGLCLQSCTFYSENLFFTGKKPRTVTEFRFIRWCTGLGGVRILLQVHCKKMRTQPYDQTWRRPHGYGIMSVDVWVQPCLVVNWGSHFIGVGCTVPYSALVSHLRSR